MRVVVVGGGKVGSFLARELRELGHAVIVVEKDPLQASRLGEETDALVVTGDGCDIHLLEDIGTPKADFFLAVTGRDEDNLVACQLVRTAFGLEKLLARMNDPRNRRTFEALDVPVVSITDMMVQVISRELDVGELVRVALLGRGEVSLLEVEIPGNVAERSVEAVPLPPSSVLVAVRREGTVIVPTADTELRPHDRVLAVTAIRYEDEVRDILLGVRKEGGHPTPGPEPPLRIDAPDQA